MKKTLVASILGLVAAASVMAQGTVKFNNYDGTTYAQVVYGGPGSGGVQGTGVNNQFTAGLYYAFGAVNWSGGYLDNSIAGFTLASVTTTINTGAFAGPAGVGFFNGGNATIPGYIGGQISFVVVAYNGANYASSAIRGSSQSFTLPEIATGLSPAGSFGPTFQSFAVNAVPEPSTFALAGLGLASLLIFRRRK
jgi:hypothetical protein